MKYLLLMLMAGYISSSSLCAQTNLETVSLYLNYAFSGDWESQEKLMHNNIIDYHPTILAESAKGRKAVLEGWEKTVNVFDSIEPKTIAQSSLSINEGDLAGDWVLDLTEVTARVTNMEKPIRFVMVGLYQFRNGLICEVRNFGNLLDLYLQMGYQVVPMK